MENQIIEEELPLIEDEIIKKDVFECSECGSTKILGKFVETTKKQLIYQDYCKDCGKI